MSLARDKDAEYLLIESSKQTTSISIKTQIDSIEKHIALVEMEINETLEALKVSKNGLKTLSETL
ncbi:hypothetical protein LCGC14_1229380 [marine sediment metagenome]|uniref:Uncharacterized protein n=1 Tax=marine sediment metagenome TaxID=412755 RepID=A0A0F9LW53_9ZZZZ